MESDADIPNPLDEALFDSCLILLVGFAIRPEKPFREVWLGRYNGSPRVDHVLGAAQEYVSMLLQQIRIFIRPTSARFELMQLVH